MNQPTPAATAKKTRGAAKAQITAIAREKAKQRLNSSSHGEIIPTIGLWNQATRVGGNLTPAVISSIIRESDTGNTRRLIDLANECRQQDSHLQAVLGTHEESISGLAWQVVPPTPYSATKPRLKDKKAAAFCEEQLRKNPNTQRLISDLAGAYFYSYAVVEIVWRKVGGKLIPDRFVHVAPRRLRFRREDGLLVLCDDGSTEVDLAAHPNKFIVCQPRVNGDTPNREGLARALVWMSAMRRWLIGDWLLTGEMSWKPWRIATYKKDNAGIKDREDLETIVRRMTTDFTAIIPDSTTIDVKWPAGSSSAKSTHSELCTMLANEMSKAVLGQTETTQASSSSGYAQASIHDGVRRDLRESRAKQIAADITRDLIGAMIRLNFGDAVDLPRFAFVTQDALDLKSFGEALKNFRDAGARIPEAWAFEQAGIPEAKKGERILGDPVPGDIIDEKPGPEKPAESVEPAEEEKPDAAEQT